MAVAYVTQPGAVLHARGRTLLVRKQGKTLARWRLLHLKALLLAGGVQVTTPAIRRLLRAGVSLTFVSRGGQLQGRLVAARSGQGALRTAQALAAHDPRQGLPLARQVVQDKLAAMREVLQAYADNYPELPLDAVRERLRGLAVAVEQAACAASLRGLEGTAAAAWWQTFPLLNRSELPFAGRSTRPPRDPLNAALSFGYALLTQEVWAQLEALGLDVFVGFYHALRPGCPSLALDVMEPFRHALVDRWVLRLVNRRQLQASDFEEGGPRGVRLTPGGLRTLLSDWEATLCESHASGDWRTRLGAASSAWRRRIQASARQSGPGTSPGAAGPGPEHGS